MDERLIEMAREAAAEVERAQGAFDDGKAELAGFRIGLSIAKSLAVIAQVTVIPEHEVFIEPPETPITWSSTPTTPGTPDG